MPHPRFLPGETDVFRVHPSLFILLFRILIVGVGVVGLLFLIISIGVGGGVFLIPLILGGFLALIFILEWLGTVYLVTSKRVEYRYGIFGIEEEEISLSDVQSVTFNQTLWGILFGFGNIKITSAAKNKFIIFKGISRPRSRANQIEDLSIG